MIEMTRVGEPPKTVVVPYPGRDLSIIALILAYTLPIIGPIIGYFIALSAVKETENKSYKLLPIHKFARTGTILLFLVEVAIIAGIKYNLFESILLYFQ